MGYWIRVVDQNCRGMHPHQELGATTMSTSWNYAELFEHLPCGWLRDDFQGKLCEDMINPVYTSLIELNTRPEHYEQYLRTNYDSIETAKTMFADMLKLFERIPDGIIVVD